MSGRRPSGSLKPRGIARGALGLGIALGVAALGGAPGLAGAQLRGGSAPATQPAAPSTPRVAPPAGQVLTLPEAVELALRQHPTIRSAVETNTAAQTRIPQAQSSYYPRIDWLSSFERSQAYSQTLGRSVQSNSIGTALAGQQLIFDFGKTAAQVNQARAGVRLTTGQLEQTRDQVVFDAKQSYYQLLAARRLVKVADAAVDRAELNLRSAKGFFDVGTKPKSDVTKAEVEVANARVDQIRARNLVRLAETNLASALGLEATTPLQVQDILDFEPVPIDPATLLQEALRNRPELSQALAKVDAARAQLDGARAGYFPDLSAFGSYGWSTNDDPPLREAWSIGIQLSWNIFQGFLTVNQVKEAQALTEAARANYDALELQVRADVEQAGITVVEAAERIGANEKAVESAQENLRLAQGRYDAGVGTILDLTDAQLALTNAEADQVRALTDHKVGLARLDRAVGRP
jgi:outer membrane protein